jgi:hypothetical protein
MWMIIFIVIQPCFCISSGRECVVKETFPSLGLGFIANSGGVWPYFAYFLKSMQCCARRATTRETKQEKKKTKKN